MPIVTITRGKYGGGGTLAEEIAAALGARCVSREVLIEAAKAYNAPEEKVAEVFETTPSFWERMTESRRIYLAYVQATLADWAKDDNLVYHGNAGQELFREVPHALKVWLIYPREYRVNRAIQELKCSKHEAERLVTQIDEDRTKRMRYMFNVDWRDPTRYDVVLRIERIQAEDARDTILRLAGRPEFQLDDVKRPKFQDFLIKSRVHAILASRLAGRPSLIDVNVSEGVVTLQGVLTSHDPRIDEVIETVGKLDGVRRVENGIVVGLVYHPWNP